MKTILVIEDDPVIRDATLDILKAEGYLAIGAANGFDGIELTRWELPNLIICDIMMPEMNGYEVLGKVRAADKLAAIPFIFLTAKTDQPSLRRAMEQGADDYLTKPFSIKQLLAAIHCRLERHDALIRLYRSQDNPVILEEKELTINFAERRVSLRGQDLNLSPQQYQLLIYLAQNAGQVVTHREALKKIWGPQYETEHQYIHVFVSQLRQKIEPDPARPYYILTERGVGYRFRSKYR